MKTRILSAFVAENIDLAAMVLRRGGLVAFPTDTVYGLAAAAFDSRAVTEIYQAKRRAPEKSIPVLLADSTELELVADPIPPAALNLASRFWPGPLTIVVPKHQAVPLAVANDTVGVRIPDHDVARAILSRTGPLAVTSANVSGAVNPTTAQDVLAQLEGRIQLVLDGGRAPGGVPSTVVDCSNSELTILRPGPLSLEQLLQALE